MASEGHSWGMINFRWIWVFLKVKTANDSIRKEQEIMQTPPKMENSDHPKKILTRKLTQTPLSRGIYPHRSQF